MPAQMPLFNAHRLRLLAWLVILMTSVFMFTYNGRIESTDTRTLFNATSSLVQYNDLLLDKTAWYNQPLPFQPPSAYPLNQFDAEPLQVTLPAPLFWLAEHLPGIGLVHSVWLFNVFVSTAIGVVLFLHVLTLGYDERVAVFATLVLSFTTIIWPYSKSFFREPLAAFLILLAAFFIERWRLSRYRSLLRLGLSAVALVGAFLAKDAVILGMPALFILVLPSPTSSRWRRLLHIAVSFALTLVITILIVLLYVPMLISPADLLALYNDLARVFGTNLSVIYFIHIALHSYLFSIGGSVWATSPVGLLSLLGMWMLYRSRQYRYTGAVIALVAGFALGYAVLRGEHWFGGLSWPPRFLIPVVPFLVIAALPVLNRALHRPTGAWVALVAVVVIYGLWVQISAVSLDWGAYNAALPPEAGGLGEWGGGLNDVRYLRWVLIPTLWSRFPLDFAWVRLGISIWPVVCIVLALLSLFALWCLLKSPTVASVPSLWTKWTPAVGLLLIPILLYLGLRALYPDNLYLGGNQSLHNILPVLQANTRPGDVLLLADDNYEPFFLNYDTSAVPRVITFADQPGERSNPDETPRVASPNPDMLLVKDAIGFLYNLAAAHDRVWLLADTGPWIPWSIRPVERFMAAHFYPIRELSTDPPDPLVRLIEYSTIPAPDPFAFRQPDQLSNLRFGDSIRLVGFDLPHGSTYRPGDVLPISLYWQSDAPLNEDYTIAWFVADQNNATVTQGYDSQPDWGFSPTTGWQPGVPVWDNRALRLPPDIQPGKYTLWLRLYNASPSGGINLLPVTVGTVLNDTIGVLPVSIDIQPQ